MRYLLLRFPKGTADVVLATAGGALAIGALGGLVSGVPGAGPWPNPLAAALAPFARAGYLVGWPLAVVALVFAVIALVVDRWLRSTDQRLLRSHDPRRQLVPLSLLLGVAAVPASALFTRWNGVDLGSLTGGSDPGMLAMLGGLAERVMPWVPAVALHVATLLLALWAASRAGRRRPTRRPGVVTTAWIVAGLGAGALLLGWVSGGTALGGALQAGPGHRPAMIVVGGLLLAAGLAAGSTAAGDDEGMTG